MLRSRINSTGARAVTVDRAKFARRHLAHWSNRRVVRTLRNIGRSRSSPENPLVRVIVQLATLRDPGWRQVHRRPQDTNDTFEQYW